MRLTHFPALFFLQIFRIDQTDYEFNGVDACEKSWDKTDTIPCGLTEGEYIF